MDERHANTSEESQVTRGQGQSQVGWLPQADQPAPAARPEEDEIFQQYMATSEEQHREIDRLAEASICSFRAEECRQLLKSLED